MGVENSKFINACYGRNHEGIPLWIMRQAGRYLPEYLAVREKASFHELCQSPELIAEVVRQPIARFGLDAAILFSDILTIFGPMGLKVEFPEGGPVLDKPIRTPDDIKRLHKFDIKKEMKNVLNGIREIKKILPETPLIGFVGSPFTLVCYMIEGQGSKNFNLAKQFIHMYPKESEELFAFVTEILAEYLEAQIDAGVETVQIFESWGGILSYDDFKKWSADQVDSVFKKLKDKAVPRIYFINNVAPYLDLVDQVDCEVIGIDYRIDLAQAIEKLPSKTVQGNLDPTILFGSPEHVAENTKKIIDSVPDKNRLIFNLGHGILPKTPLESVQAMVETVHNYR